MMLILFLSLFLQNPRPHVTPPSVLFVDVPVSPYGAVRGGVAVADITVSGSGSVERTALLQGSSPYSDEMLRAVGSWRFNPGRIADRTATSHVGILTLFRPAAMGNFGVGGSYFGFNPSALAATVGVAGGSFGFNAPAPTKVDHPAFPQSISDPGYPQNSIAEGTVVLEVTVDKGGNPMDIRVVHDIPTLTEISRSAVRSWRFLPAVDSGETVEGKVIVAIAYQRPV